MELTCKKCKKVFATSVPPTTVDRMAMASGLCGACMREELTRDIRATASQSRSPAWVVIKLRNRLHQLRNDLLRIIPRQGAGATDELIIKSSLREVTIPLSDVQPDGLNVLLDWFAQGKEVHGLFADGDWKTAILCAPVSDISTLRSCLKAYEGDDSKRENRGVQPAKTTRYARYDSALDEERYFDPELEQAQWDHEFLWETEQLSLDDLIEEWERNRGHNLTTYDDIDD